MSESKLKKVIREVSTPGYYGTARQRAERRKGPWNLLFILFVLGITGVVGYGLLRSILFF